ncbi:alpha-(1,3)-fucosyltransferase 7 [Arapaima gigas]
MIKLHNTGCSCFLYTSLPSQAPLTKQSTSTPRCCSAASWKLPGCLRTHLDQCDPSNMNFQCGEESQTCSILPMFSTRYSTRCLFQALVGLFSLSTCVLYWVATMDNGGRIVASGHGNLTILLWHWPFGKPYNLAGDVCSDWYGISGCLLEDSRSLFHQADIVVFHHTELKTGSSHLPLNLCRPPSQKWIWLSLESPNTNQNLTNLNGLMNWTMSYRQDADIFIPYGKLIPKTSKGNYTVPKKSCLVCWVVSNFQLRHKRTMIYQTLRQLIPIEVYGMWTKKPLATSQLLPTISRCHFYLAFENSQAKDYITEKLWRNSFQAGAVPVVLGPPRANYEEFVPGSSFIHVDDFNSTAELAQFLIQLASDEERYSSYFEWHQHHDVKLYTDWRERLCSICDHYDQLSPSKVYHDLDSWANAK